MSEKDWCDSVASIAASLAVAGVTTVGPWTHWLLRHKPGALHCYSSGDTYVMRGPSCLIVTGDMGSMLFERPGGLGLSLGNLSSHGLGYISEKCAAGEAFVYSAEKAMSDIEAHLDDLVGDMLECEELVDLVFDRLAEAEFIELEDGDSVRRWFNLVLNEGNDWWDIGRVPSSDLIRALGCISAVREHENSRPDECDHHDIEVDRSGESATVVCWRCGARRSPASELWTVGEKGEVESCTCT